MIIYLWCSTGWNNVNPITCEIVNKIGVCLTNVIGVILCAIFVCLSFKNSLVYFLYTLTLLFSVCITLHLDVDYGIAQTGLDLRLY